MGNRTKHELGPILATGWNIAWKQRWSLLAFTFILWGSVGIVLAPLTKWILRGLAGYQDVIVGNYTLHLWLLTPKGLSYLILAGSLSLLATFLQLGGMLYIIGTTDDNAASARNAFFLLIEKWKKLLQLSITLFLASIPVLLIIAAGPCLFYLLLLAEHDINYYLTRYPPEWIVMLSLSCLWILLTGGSTLVVLLRCLFALPIWLHKGLSIRQAIQESWQATRGHLKPLLTIALSSVGSAVGALAIIHLITFALAGYLISQADSLEGTVRIMATHLALNVLLEWGLGFLALIWIAGVWLTAYRNYIHHTQNPAVKTRIASTKAVAAYLLRIRLIIPAIVLLSAGSWAINLWAFKQEGPTKMPAIIAHRAGAATAPENTLAALNQTLREKMADMSEIDVTLTLDGELVVAHDKDLMKQAGDPRIIRETNYADLKTADIGIHFGAPYAGQKLERLESFLQMTKDKRSIIVEFKHGADTDLVERTIALVRAMEMEEQVILMSLELDEVRKVKELASEIRGGYFASVELGDLRKLNVDILGLKDSLANPAFIQDFQALGGRIFVWTVDDPYRILELIEMGVDGIITNDPTTARDVITRFNALKPEQRVLLQFRDFWKILQKKKQKLDELNNGRYSVAGRPAQAFSPPLMP